MNQPDQPVFSEPWEAQAFALAVKLSEQGYFTWKEWSEALADEIKAGGDRSYYQNWLRALEGLVTAKGLTTPEAIETRKEAWANAYRHTPHGKPVILNAPDAPTPHAPTPHAPTPHAPTPPRLTFPRLTFPSRDRKGVGAFSLYKKCPHPASPPSS